MQASEATTKREQEIRYYASGYVSKQHGEIIFSVMQVEFMDQLCEREPVLALDLEASPDVVGLALKAVLADSNINEATNNPSLTNRLSDISEARIFYTRSDYARNQFIHHDKQTHFSNTYYDRPAYQASKAQTINDFSKYYLHLRIEATSAEIFMSTVFNEWNPVHLAKQVPLNIENEVLGTILLGFSKACLSKSA